MDKLAGTRLPNIPEMDDQIPPDDASGAVLPVTANLNIANPISSAIPPPACSRLDDD